MSNVLHEAVQALAAATPLWHSVPSVALEVVKPTKPKHNPLVLSQVIAVVATAAIAGAPPSQSAVVVQALLTSPAKSPFTAVV